jgi:hypothetical protein
MFVSAQVEKDEAECNCHVTEGRGHETKLIDVALGYVLELQPTI